MITDANSMVSFELARRFGSARFDRVLGAVKILDGRPAVWFDAEGMFEPDGLAKLIAALGGTAEVDGERLTAEIAPLLLVTADREHLRIVDPGVGDAGGAEHGASLRAAGLGKGAPVWIHVPEGSSLLDFEIPLPMPESAVMEWTFEKGMEVKLTCPYPSAEQAAAIVAALNGMKAMGEQHLAALLQQDELLAPVVDPLVAALRGAKVKAKEAVITVAVAIRGLDPDHLARLLLALR